MTPPNEREESSMNTKCRCGHQWLTKLSKRGVRGAVALLLLLPVAAWAGGVVTNCTEAALRAAMAGGGAVAFACDGTITLAGTITNNVDLTLDGSGHQVTISGSNAVRVFYVNTNVTFTVVNLTIADGFSLGGSAILNVGGTVSLTGVSFLSNTAKLYGANDDMSLRSSGGAIFNRGGTVNASNCSFVGNTAQTPGPSPWPYSPPQVFGGAIRNESGQVNLRSCAFVGNRASGGADNAAGYFADGDPGFGGAIHNSGTVTLSLCNFAGNSATGGAGDGVVSYGGSSGGEGSGGAILNQGTLTVDQTTLCGNTATGGSGGMGGWYHSGGIPNGYAGGAGGEANGAAICNLGSLWVTRSTLASNVVTGGPGAPWHEIGATGALGGNGSSGLGGALFNSAAASLVNCTLAFNTGSGGT